MSNNSRSAAAWRASVRMVVTLEPLHDEFTRMSIVGFTSQLAKLDKRFGAR